MDQKMSNKGGKPIDNARSFQRQAHTPQNQQRHPFNFDFRGQRNSKNISIVQNTPKIERSKPQNFSIISKNDTAKNGFFQHPNFIQTPQIQVKEPIQPIQVKRAPIAPIPPLSDYASKHSLQAFISEFEEKESYNETDLTELGIDVNTMQPILPNLQSVFSEIPLGSKSSYKSVQSYNSMAAEPDMKNRISIFSTQTLLFIYYTGKKRDMHLAKTELQRRGCTFNRETDEWTLQNGLVWDPSKWNTDNAAQ